MAVDPIAFMREAVALARRGRRRVEPNPQVGAVIVKNGEIVGRGFHRQFGGAHAEVEALKDAGDAAEGGHAYVTLEPCSTIGKTPACTQGLIDAGIARVTYAIDDPNPKHAGGARKILEEAGIQVEVGLGRDEAATLLVEFEKFIDAGRPFIVSKWASTLDGRTATVSGDSRWITCDDSRVLVHAERARCQGILVGVETVLADDPELTTRLAPGPSPRRYVLDSRLRTPVGAKLFDPADPPVTIFYSQEVDDANRFPLEAAGARVVPVAATPSGLDLDEVLGVIRREEGVGRLLVEGGAGVHGSFLGAGLVDQVQIFLAPKILGAGDARPSVSGPSVKLMAQAALLADPVYETVGRDLLVIGDLEGRI